MIGIHAGQCGNQLGHCLLDGIYAHLSNGNQENQERSQNHSRSQSNEEEDMNFYFRQNQKTNEWISRTICMDTEPKVIHECVTSAKRSKKWKYCEENTHYLHGGAGNNWAMGYQMCSGKFRDAGIDSIRRELEDVDIPTALVVIHSVGGGTGSGLGTRMTEEISDEFPDSSLLNVSVMPYHFGEVVVQHYNSVLCLSKVAQASQSILLFENETAHHICSTMRGISRPTLYDINRTLISSLIPVILPKSSSSLRRKITLTEELIPLSSHPGYKFLDVKITPQTSLESVDFTCDQWSTLLSTVDRMSQLGQHTERGLGSHLQPSSHTSPSTPSAASGQLMKHLAASLTLFGPDSEEAVQSAASFPLTETTRAPWSRSSQEQQLYHSLLSVNGYYRSCCLISNSQAILSSLTRPVQHGGRLFASGAYTHQYLSCGLELEEFVSSFRYLGQVIHNYRSL